MQVEANEKHHARLLELILLDVSDSILIFDSAWQLVLANKAAQQVFNAASPGAALETILQDDPFAKAVRSGDIPREWQTPDETYTCQPRLISHRDEDGGAEHFVLIMKDITALKKLTFNQNEFVHIVSHDLRTPLTTIKGYTGMLGMGAALDNKQKDYVDKVLSGIQQLTNLVDNIQDAGRYDIETGFYVTQRSHCDVTEIVRRVVSGYVIPSDKQDLQLTVELAQDVPIINADNNMLERALTNLVDNAIKYTPNGGKITVKVAREGNHLVVSVTDTGPGISQEDQKKLFQRHSRINREEFKRIKGTGLGLFIVRSVAQRHDGDAWVKSAPNEGSMFAFYIPLEGANLIFNSE